MTDHEATARNIMDEACLPVNLHERGVYSACVSAIASALREAEAGETQRCLDVLSGEIKIVTLGDVAIAKGFSEADVTRLLNQGMMIAKAAIRGVSGEFEEDGVTVDVTELAAAIRSRNDE